MKITEQQLREWLESPVTLALQKKCEIELGKIVGIPAEDFFIRRNAQLTQANILENVTKGVEWTAFIKILKGDWTEIDDEE